MAQFVSDERPVVSHRAGGTAGRYRAAVTKAPDGGLQILGVGGLPEIVAGDDLAMLIAAAFPLLDDDVVVVTSKVVSKAEGAVVDLVTIEPSPFAADFARRWDKDARVVEVVLSQAVRIVRMSGP